MKNIFFDPGTLKLTIFFDLENFWASIFIIRQQKTNSFRFQFIFHYYYAYTDRKMIIIDDNDGYVTEILEKLKKINFF